MVTTPYKKNAMMSKKKLAFEWTGRSAPEVTAASAWSSAPRPAIRLEAPELSTYEYVVDPDRCIGCGFCAGACPCGVWNLVENEVIG